MSSLYNHITSIISGCIWVFTMNMYGRALPQLAVLYTHNGEEEWEQQQMQHGCHDHSLGRERGRGGGEMWGRAVSKTVKESAGGWGGPLRSLPWIQNCGAAPANEKHPLRLSMLLSVQKWVTHSKSVATNVCPWSIHTHRHNLSLSARVFEPDGNFNPFNMHLREPSEHSKTESQSWFAPLTFPLASL